MPHISHERRNGKPIKNKGSIMNTPKKNPTKVKIQNLEKQIDIAIQGMKGCNLWMAEKLDEVSDRINTIEKHLGINQQETVENAQDDKVNQNS